MPKPTPIPASRPTTTPASRPAIAKTNGNFSLSEVLLQKFTQLQSQFPTDQPKAALIPILHLVQAQHPERYLSTSAMDAVANFLGIEPVEVYEVASFYTMFRFQPSGKFLIEVCQTSSCWLCGAEQILSHLKNRLGIAVGETTADGVFSLRTVECLGACGGAPAIQIGECYYENMDTKEIDAILDEHRAQATSSAYVHIDQYPHLPVNPSANIANTSKKPANDKPALSTRTKPPRIAVTLQDKDVSLLLKYDHIPNMHRIHTYEQHEGYTVAKRVIGELKPEAVLEEVKTSGLRGRGGAGFPTGLKWSFLAKPEGIPRYLVCNADESEPGTFKDRYLMERHPHLVLEGIILSCYALGAQTCYIYIRGEYFYLIQILQAAIVEAHEKGYIGENIFGSKNHLQIIVHPGAGAYICGEETALLESLEGKRGNPRSKPPFPAVHGLFQCPTIVNNVETLAAVVPILQMGGKEYANIGIGKSTGTKLISASGHINRPGVYEIELGLSVKDFIYNQKFCGGIPDGRKIKAAVVGGSSVPALPERLLLETQRGEPRLMSYESLADGGFETGSMLGSGGFIVMDERTNLVHNLHTFARFYHHESCGQCSPCREGTGWMEQIIRRFVTGDAQVTEADIDLLWSVQSQIEGNTICPFGDAAAWPVASVIRHFRDDFLACLEDSRAKRSASAQKIEATRRH